MRSRRLYLERHVFEFVIGVLSIIAAISFANDPESLRRTAVGQQLSGWDFVWNGGYGLAGLLIVVGLVIPKPRVEAAGLLLLATALTINVLAIWQVAGTIGATAIASYAAVVIACVGRVRQMIRVGLDAG
jgi:hypothetical protein